MNDFLTFNPGPSQLSKETKSDIEKASQSHILELSHRSKAFSEMSERAIRGLREFFHIPEAYEVFYTSSATEAMISTVQNGVEKNVFHFVNGSFSEKFSEVSLSLGKSVHTDFVKAGSQNDFQTVNISEGTELFTVTINETSTGVMARKEDIEFLRKKFPDPLFVVDATSLAGGIALEIENADIWLFSVQKCFGLPSGLGILIVSPRAMEKSREMKKNGTNLASLFAFEELKKHMDGKYQTVQTPNILNIFLLGEQLARWNGLGGMAQKERETLEKYEMGEKYITGHSDCSFLVEDARFRSPTVLCIRALPETIERIHAHSRSQNIILGNGYGERKKDTFRIANFPAHSREDLSFLLKTIGTSLH